MSRPSRNLDRALIDAARDMLPQAGFSGLKIREVARRAKVNPGMFHYHFKSREAFLARVLEEVYEDFLSTFTEAAARNGSPEARLRALLVAVAKFARDNRVFYTLMIRELLNAEPTMSGFGKANFARHIAVLAALMEECKRAGAVRKLPTPMLCMFAMGSMALPALAVTGLERNGVKTVAGEPLAKVGDLLLSDAMIAERADMVLAALRRPK
jgi:AcrR family transcriptional regulator